MRSVRFLSGSYEPAVASLLPDRVHIHRQGYHQELSAGAGLKSRGLFAVGDVETTMGPKFFAGVDRVAGQNKPDIRCRQRLLSEHRARRQLPEYHSGLVL